MRKILLSFAALVLAAAPAFAADKAIKIGAKAPGFDALPAVMGDKDVSVSLSDVKEDVVIVTFLANHCPAVVANEDRLIDLAKSFEGKSVKIIGISVTTAPGQKQLDDIAGIKTRIKEKGYNYVYAYDESQATGKAYDVKVTPTTFVLDKARNIRYSGAIDDSVMDETKAKTPYVKNAVEALLAGKEVEKTETRATGCGISYKRSK